jgi:hypothetical protein
MVFYAWIAPHLFAVVRCLECGTSASVCTCSLVARASPGTSTTATSRPHSPRPPVPSTASKPSSPGQRPALAQGPPRRRQNARRHRLGGPRCRLPRRRSISPVPASRSPAPCRCAEPESGIPTAIAPWLRVDHGAVLLKQRDHRHGEQRAGGHSYGPLPSALRDACKGRRFEVMESPVAVLRRLWRAPTSRPLSID